MEPEEKKELIKFNLSREDSLNHNRLSWMLAFQGFLFASYFLANDEKEYLPYLGIVGAIATISVAALGVVSVRRLLICLFSARLCKWIEF